MKVLILLCLAALAYAESDPYLYGRNVYGRGVYSPYSTLGYSTLGYSNYYNRPASVYSGFGNTFGYRTLFKRDAEAEPQWINGAFPYSGIGYANTGFGYANTGFGYPTHTAAAYSPFVHQPYNALGVKTYSNDAISSPVNYASKGQYAAVNAGAAHFAKREAEAEPQWLNGAFPYSGIGYANNGFGYANAGFGYATHTAAAYRPYVQHPYSFVGPKSYSNDAVKPFNYASKGQYAAVNPGAAHFAKRDAEAEPLVYTHPASLSTYAVGSTYYPRNVYSGYTGYTGFNGYSNAYGFPYRGFF